MAHEIEQHDKVVLHKNQAWHGLGIVVEDAPTPTKALKLAGLDWTVEQWPLAATNGERKRIALEDKVLNVRSDTLTPLGIVSPEYQPVQNKHLAEFCELLAEQSDVVTVESAGSIRNGERVWFLLKGESFSVRKKDEVRPYICVSNGHDGGTAIRCTPTSVRVVCSNTLHLVIPRFEKGKLVKATPGAFVANHLGDVKDKIEQAKGALELYGKTLADTRELIDQAAAKNLNSDAVARFLLGCYVRRLWGDRRQSEDPGRGTGPHQGAGSDGRHVPAVRSREGDRRGDRVERVQCLHRLVAAPEILERRRRGARAPRR